MGNSILIFPLTLKLPVAERQDGAASFYRRQCLQNNRFLQGHEGPMEILTAILAAKLNPNCSRSGAASLDAHLWSSSLSCAGLTPSTNLHILCQDRQKLTLSGKHTLESVLELMVYRINWYLSGMILRRQGFSQEFIKSSCLVL